MLSSSEIASQAITGWQPFFTVMASTAAVLAGLLFVALTLHLPSISANPAYRYRARLSLASLLLVFVVSGLVLLPRQPGTWLGLEELVVLVFQTGATIWHMISLGAVAVRHPSGLRSVRPYLLRTAVGVVSSMIAIIGTVLLLTGFEFGLYIVAFYCLGVLVWMVVNTWALVVGIPDEEGSSGNSM